MIAGMVAAGVLAAAPGEAVAWQKCRLSEGGEVVRCATYQVWEDREGRRGRRIPMRIVVLPAKAASPGTPILFFGGGPGQTSTDQAPEFLEDPRRARHDLVFVDQRGTSEGARLECERPGSDGDLQGLLEPFLTADYARRCREKLQREGFDLSRYGTADEVEDLEEVRRALGYERFDVDTGSFGTYLAVQYIARYPTRVRTALLASQVSTETRVPLHHAEQAQAVVDRLFTECEADAGCRGAFPTVRADFAAILARLDAGPVEAQVKDGETGKGGTVKLGRQGFADAVRVMTYAEERSRRLPLLITRAKAGDFSPFAQTAIDANRRLYDNIRMGSNLAVTCTEMVARIREREIPALTRGTYLGEARVRGQMAACAQWPKTRVPKDFYKRFKAGTAVVFTSSTLDPATSRRWADELQPRFADSVHVVIPGGHSAWNECIGAIGLALAEAGTTRGLDVGCAAASKPLPWVLE